MFSEDTSALADFFENTAKQVSKQDSVNNCFDKVVKNTIEYLNGFDKKIISSNNIENQALNMNENVQDYYEAIEISDEQSFVYLMNDLPTYVMERKVSKCDLNTNTYHFNAFTKATGTTKVAEELKTELVNRLNAHFTEGYATYYLKNERVVYKYSPYAVFINNMLKSVMEI